MSKTQKHIIILTTILLWLCVSVFAGEVREIHFMRDSYASGERTVKSSGENAAMFVNAEFAGGMTNTAKFSLYVSPYLVANQGGRYTKHIYIGSQRIVSKLGDLKSYGADPRRIEYAGSESDGPKVDYKSKYAQQQQAIKDNFAHFDVPYNGTDNNDYVDGKGFSERDGSLKSAMLKAASLKDNFQQGDSYEQYQYFYHPDHLGSSSFITNTEGEVVQHIEYVPYGEVFIEERNNVWNTPYLFNAKEFDEETGLYYYGARYYDPRLAMWYGVDALTEKYPNMSPYNYCVGNPVKFVDVDGNEPTANEAALMAIHVYRNDNAEEYLKKLNASGWFISNVANGIKLNYTQWYENGLQSEVFERTSNGVTEYAYVFAGTNSLEDALEDIAQVIYFAPQYDVPILNALAISKATNGHELTFVGHSLGGGEAAAASMALGHRAITFNAAAVSPLLKFRYGLSDDSQITNYVIIGRNGSFFKGGDPLTNIQDAIGLKAPGKRISIPIQSSDWVHTINEFLKHDLPEL